MRESGPQGEPTGSPEMRVVPLGREGLAVSALGLGCMVMSGMYDVPDPEEARATFERALEVGITLLDTADSYSRGENERFVGGLLGPRRDRVVLATKFGLVPKGEGGVGVNGRPEHARGSCEASLARLGTDRIDLYYLHRIDPAVPVEESVGAMRELIEEGKVRFLGICEARPEELRRAHAVHPISALQSEWSLWARAIERDVVPVARELGIGLVPYGPLGRGFLTGAITADSTFSRDDRRADDPRFVGSNREANLRLVAELRAMATAKGATPAQLALAWLRAQGDDVVPIPGAERRTFLEENVASLRVELSSEELAQLSSWFPEGAAAGNADHVHMRDLR